MKKILSLVMMFVITITVGASALAAEMPCPFSDLDSEVSRDAALYLYGKGIVVDAPDGQFHPERALTGGEFCAMLVRALYPDAARDGPGQPWYAPYLDVLRERDVITGHEAELLERNAITRAVIWNVTLPLFAIYPYPHELYPEISPVEQVSGIYADARCAAIKTGLAHTRDHPNMAPTRGEFAVFLADLMRGGHLPLEHYDSGIDYVELQPVTAETYHARNAMILGYWNIPQKYRDQFRADGWTVVFSNTAGGEGDRAVKGGLTSYKLKTIFLNRCGESGVYHEFGHYISEAAGIRDYMYAFFHAEAPAARPLVGEYAMTGEQEFFAECFAYWLACPEGRDALRAAAPRTAALIESGLIGADGLCDRALVRRLAAEVPAQ